MHRALHVCRGATDGRGRASGERCVRFSLAACKNQSLKTECREKMGELEIDARSFADEQKKRSVRGAKSGGKKNQSSDCIQFRVGWTGSAFFALHLLRVRVPRRFACAARGSGSDELAKDRNEMPGWRRAEDWINRMGRKL